MRTRVIPSYANLFMGQLEEFFFFCGQRYTSHIVLCQRYIDDLFFTWQGTEA